MHEYATLFVRMPVIHPCLDGWTSCDWETCAGTGWWPGRLNCIQGADSEAFFAEAVRWARQPPRNFGSLLCLHEVVTLWNEWEQCLCGLSLLIFHLFRINVFKVSCFCLYAREFFSTRQVFQRAYTIRQHWQCDFKPLLWLTCVHLKIPLTVLRLFDLRMNSSTWIRRRVRNSYRDFLERQLFAAWANLYTPVLHLGYIELHEIRYNTNPLFTRLPMYAKG